MVAEGVRGGLSRGEFARRGGLSPEALRLYERSGLLVPDRVGDWFYAPGQVERARRIGLLRRLGVPSALVALVAQVVDLGGAEAAARVGGWWRAQEEAMRSRRGALEELRLSWAKGFVLVGA
ncbi:MULTISPECIES: MerR family transcriptional regulator [Nocardiopsidaceae]|uniref:MerR family transcriptional regulator n=1 Tax=Streptomonospora nanhaiensis TaxID=1323731 RepID=A0ABY6YWE3_9ACTN|nr:MerR family transcriptional regulator [Streptomonospora nanhaiensis]WAE76416.1 MerR family transcriptional regulator [Streptomonospora nanhaiensis]